MNKKVTVKDVAREAGVSVATVSYVINDTPGQRISPETKKKVLQIANLLNYRPSHAAKSLATGKTNMIGLAYKSYANSPSRSLELTHFISLLTARLQRMHYDVTFVSVEEGNELSSINRNLDGIIAIDLTQEQFRFIAETFLIPIINVDMLIQDSLFYQIYTEYPRYLKKICKKDLKECSLVMDAYENKAFLSYITEAFDPSQVYYFSELNKADLEKLKDETVIVIGQYIALGLCPYIPPEQIYAICSEDKLSFLPASMHCLQIDISRKANLTINILLNAIDRNFDVAHDYPV